MGNDSKALSVGLRVVVVFNLLGSGSFVGKRGTIVGMDRKWWLVALDGMSAKGPIGFRTNELEPA